MVRRLQRANESPSDCLGHASRQGEIRLRRLKAGDSLEHLTGMLHRAYSRLGEMGIPCSCVTQTTETTRQRVASGDCFVAVSGEHIVGTVTVYAPEAASDSRHYRDARVASVRQLGVDPHIQGKGVGTALLHLAEHWARRRGYARLALDTPEPAGHLVDYYRCLGFRVVETLKFSCRPYRSVVFEKPLRHHAAAYRCPLSPSGKLRGYATPPIQCRYIRPRTGSVRASPCHHLWPPGNPLKLYCHRC
ncbi:MAG: GNAT family N-acetyltransferase [Proteobacteria bacterium]|nr:GNAT family N-acetyltransferase [Pseudomonadota bacterium]